MKKYSIVLGMTICFLALAGCNLIPRDDGDAGKEAPIITYSPKEEPKKTEPSEAPSFEPTAEPGVSPSPIVVPKSDVTPLEVTFTTQKTDYMWSGDRYLLTGQFAQFYADYDENEVLAEALSELNVELMDRFDSVYGPLLEDINENCTDPLEWIFGTFEESVYPAVIRSDSNVVSLLTYEEYYGGGAHGDSVYRGYNFDTKTGKRLSIMDVVGNMDAFLDALCENLTDVPDDFFAGSTLKQYLADNYLNGSFAFNFTIDEECLTVYFNNYEIAPYAYGPSIAHLKFKDYPMLFNLKYVEIPYSYAVLLNEYAPFMHGFAGEDALNKLVFTTAKDDYEDLYAPITSYVISNNGKLYTRYCNADRVSPYFMHTGDKDYLYVAVNDYCDNEYIDIFEILKDKYYFLGTMENTVLVTEYEYAPDSGVAGTSTLADPSDFKVYFYNDLPYTGLSIQYCEIGSDGFPRAKENVYHFSEWCFVYVAYDFDAEVLTKDWERTGNMATLKKNDCYYIRRSDGLTYLDIEDGNGNGYRLNMRRDDETGDWCYIGDEWTMPLYQLFMVEDY